MADTGGIAALMKSLNAQPSLSGQRTSGVSKSSGISNPSANSFSSAVNSTSPAQTGSAALRAARTSLASATTGGIKLPKIASPEGKGFDPKAPKGTYVNVVI